MKTNLILGAILCIALCQSSLIAQFTFHPWSHAQVIAGGGDFEIVNMDGDQSPDRLYLLRNGNTVIAAGWQSISEEGISSTRPISMPDFEVSEVGVIDADQDGDGDILFVNASSGLVYVSKQECQSELEPAIRLESSTGSYLDFKIHDMNGDGIEDLIGISMSSPLSHIMELGQGDEQYGEVQSVFIGYTMIFNRRYQDMNGDGITDITISTGGASRILYYPGRATGGWGSEVLIRSISNAMGSAIGDIDGDGLPDMISVQFTGNQNTIRLSRNLGNDEYELISLIPGEVATFSLSCADINNDGLDDILVSNRNGFGCWLYINDGDLEFSKREIYDDTNASASFSDVDGDQKLDVVLRDIGNANGNSTRWLRGNGNGGLSNLQILYPRYQEFPSYRLADVTSDGIIDKVALVTFFGAHYFWLHEGIGNGRFEEQKLLLKENAISSNKWELAHVNGDEYIDIVFMKGNDIYSATSNSSQSFAIPQTLLNNVRDFILIDNSTDRYADFVIQDNTGDDAYWIEHTADGIESKLLFEGRGIQLYDQDIELDGYTDVFISSRGSNSRQIVVVNNTIEGLQASEPYETEVIPGRALRTIAPIDIDLDGIADIISNAFDTYQWNQGKADGTYEETEILSSIELPDVYETIYVPEENQRVIWQKGDDYAYQVIDSPQNLSVKRYFIEGYQGPIYSRADVDNDGRIDMLTNKEAGSIGWMTTSGTSTYELVILQRPCNDDAGVVSISSGCNDDYSIEWSDGYEGDYRDNLEAGTYQYTVLADGDTLAQHEFTLSSPETLGYTFQTMGDSGANNGAFRIITTVGVQAQNITWINAEGVSGNSTTGLTEGEYTVTWDFGGGCTITDTIIIDGLVSIKTINSLDFTVTPTLAQNSLSVITKTGRPTNFTIASSNGQKVMEGSLAESTTLDISSLSGGIFYCRIYSDEGTGVEKFVVVR